MNCLPRYLIKLIKLVMVISVVIVVCRSDQLRLVGEFESQVRDLLESQMLTRAQVATLSAVFHDLEDTLQSRWPGSVVYPLGSLATGLAMKSSDADCMVTVPLYDVYNVTANRYLILQAVSLLKQQPALYDRVRPRFRPRNQISLLRFNYYPTQRKCDVNFISTHGLEITRMIAHYYSLDDRALTIAAVIKYWSKIHQTQETSYTLNLLIIFYLQQETILPPYYLIQKDLKAENMVGDWERSVQRLPYNWFDVYRLLGGFFKFYSEFNFDEYVVSPLLGRPIRKREFDDIDSLPAQLSSYKIYMRKPNSRPFVLNTKLCVQDVFLQHINIMVDILPHHVAAFMSHIKYAALMYKSVTSDRFLRAILTY